MNKPKSLLLQLTGLLFFGTLFALAWIFFKERMLNYDPSFFSFRIIFDKNYDVELGRWGSIVSQVLPLYLLKAGCSLETFLRTYSISFILIYYLIFLVITLLLRNARAAIILMLTLCIAFRHAFYYSTAELYQGLAICILVWALVFPEREYGSGLKKNMAYLISYILIFVLSYYHQILLFPLIFIFIYNLISEKKYTDKYLIGVFLFTLIWFFIRIKFLTATTYEKDKIPELSVFVDQARNILHLPSYLYFKYFAKHIVFPLVLLNIICVGGLLLQRKFLLSVFYCLFNAGFIYLNIVTYAKGESPLMYENYLTILGLFCAVPLSAILQRVSLEWLRVSLLLIILAFSISGIYESRYPFSQKTAYLKRITDYGRTMPEKKYVVDSRNLPWEYDWVSWSLPFETLLYSSLESPDSAVSVCMTKPVNQYDSLFGWKYIFLGPSFAITWFWTKDLNAAYFKLPPGTYRKLTTLQSDTSFQESVFDTNNIRIEPVTASVHASHERMTIIPIRITNSSRHLLRSVPDIPWSIYLSYHVLNENGDTLIWDGARTPLETDIEKEITQGLTVNNELSKGNYLLGIDFVTEGKRWWGIRSKVKFTVN